MTDWRGIEIQAARSRGGVIAVADPLQNLIRSGVNPWPPPEVVQKLYRSRQDRAFDGEDHGTVTGLMGYYTDLQSLRSEDAITWSVFGTLAYSKPSAREAYCRSLFALLGLPPDAARGAHVWLWRRLPHPDTLVPGGPEVDFGIQSEDAIVLGEAKWLSGVGSHQGKARNKDQLALRQEFMEKYGRGLWPDATALCLLTVSRRGGMQRPGDVDLGFAMLRKRDVVWDDLCAHTTHPCAPELGHYLAWKDANSRAA